MVFNTHNTYNMKYLITTEEGEHFVASEYSTDMFNALCDGLLTIIRLEDGKILNYDGKWEDLPVYEHC